MITFDADSDGTTFQIWKQDQANSCGVASMWMARSQVRQMTFAEEEWSLARRVYLRAVASALAAVAPPEDAPMTFQSSSSPALQNQNTMANTFGNFGLYISELITAIQSEGMKVVHNTGNGSPITVRTGALGETSPAIAFVKWNGTGAHFIVAARVTSGGRIVFLDPWDGKINEQMNNGQYLARYGSRGTVTNVLYLSA